MSQGKAEIGMWLIIWKILTISYIHLGALKESGLGNKGLN